MSSKLKRVLEAARRARRRSFARPVLLSILACGSILGPGARAAAPDGSEPQNGDAAPKKAQAPAEKPRDDAGSPRPSEGGASPKAAPGPAGKAKPRVVIHPPAEKPPEKVTLPASGEHPAEDLLSLAGVLTGRTVRLESERVLETRIKISEEVAKREVGLDELKLLLAAHRIFLFPFTDAKEGEIIVASRNPLWKDEPPRATKVLDVGPRGFAESLAKVEQAIEAYNAKLPAGESGVFAVPDERTGKIILGGSSEDALRAVETSLLGEAKPADPDRPHLYAYTGRYRPVAELTKGLEDRLSAADLNRVRIVPTRGNRLLLRAPPSVWEKVEATLKDLDQKK